MRLGITAFQKKLRFHTHPAESFSTPRRIPPSLPSHPAHTCSLTGRNGSRITWFLQHRPRVYLAREMSARPASIVPAIPSCLPQNLSQCVSLWPKMIRWCPRNSGTDAHGCERGRWVISLSGTNIPRPTPNTTVPDSPSKCYPGKEGNSRVAGRLTSLPGSAPWQLPHGDPIAPTSPPSRDRPLFQPLHRSPHLPQASSSSSQTSPCAPAATRGCPPSP